MELSAVDRLIPDQSPQERRLAGAVGADDPDSVPRPYDRTGSAEQQAVTDPLFELVESQQHGAFQSGGVDEFGWRPARTFRASDHSRRIRDSGAASSCVFTRSLAVGRGRE